MSVDLGTYIFALEQIEPGYIWDIAKSLAFVVDHGGRIFVAGNGGSHCIAQHLASDLTKPVGAAPDGNGKLSYAHNLSDNVALMTALANDVAYQNIFVEQLEYLQLSPPDGIIVFSVSGSSLNIECLLEYANAKKVYVAAVAGNEPYIMRSTWNFLTVKTGLHKKSPDHYYVCESAFSCIAHAIAKEFHILRGNYDGQG